MKALTLEIFAKVNEWVNDNHHQRGCRIDMGDGLPAKIYITTTEFGPLSLKFVETGCEDFSAMLKESVESQRRAEYEKLKAHFEPEGHCLSQCCGTSMPDWPDSDICPHCKEHTGLEDSE